MRRAVLLAVIALFLVGCAKPEPKPLSEKGEKLYTLKGKILSRDVSDNSLRLDHEAIPGFMEAMTMDYPVRGAKVQELPPNKSKVVARLHVNDDRYWLTDVRKAP
jgi:protein SCO1